MKYPEKCKNVIDVTKAPYNADNTGKTDCTKQLIMAFDDVLKDYVTALEETRQKLYELSDGLKEDVSLGQESGRVRDGVMSITFPEFKPAVKIIYFPKGTYKVSDTITYSMKNINTWQWPTYKCELCCNIHILGEDKENTIIKLEDNSNGFDNLKPVICFNTASEPYSGKETTNCAFQNTVRDITVDCGKGNDKAIGIYYVSSNDGSMENVNIKAENGHCGIYFDIGSEGVFRNINIKGFDYGFSSQYTSPILLENIDVSGNKLAGMLSVDGAVIERNFYSGNIPAFELSKGTCGRLYLYDDLTYTGDTECICRKKEASLLEYKPIPQKNMKDYEDFVLIDDFGAVGDGVTDSTRAIQKAMNSGKSTILFGSGPYLIKNTIKIPKTVKIIDFMYGSLAAGIDLITGEVEAAFDIAEESNNPLFIENLVTHEQFYGYFRSFKHSVKRTVVFSDMHTSFASIYFNTAGGSEVYIDNCFVTTGSYTQSGFLRQGYKPVFSKVLPWEFHNQTVYASNLNIERADVELLNDGSEIHIDGYKTEGGGISLKSVNGGKTQINICNLGLWDNHLEENSMFDLTASEIEMSGVYAFGFADEEKYCTALTIDGKKSIISEVGNNTRLRSLWSENNYNSSMIEYYKNEK